MKTILICAVSHEGFIARGPEDPLDWIPRSNTRFFAKTTKRIGVVIMGRRTRQMIPRPLADRCSIILSRELGGLLPSLPQEEMYTNMTPSGILSTVAWWGYTKVAVVGGAEVNTLFLKEGLIDEVWLSRIPVFLGAGVPLTTELWEDQYPRRSFTPMVGGVWVVKYRRAQ